MAKETRGTVGPVDLEALALHAIELSGAVAPCCRRPGELEAAPESGEGAR